LTPLSEFAEMMGIEPSVGALRLFENWCGDAFRTSLMGRWSFWHCFLNSFFWIPLQTDFSAVRTSKFTKIVPTCNVQSERLQRLTRNVESIKEKINAKPRTK
jgi:hypothetical protein